MKRTNTYGGKRVSSEEVERYLPFIRKIVYQLNLPAGCTLDYDDCVSIGTYALIKALNSYDHRRKTTFETYARQRIRGEVIDEIRRRGQVSRHGAQKVMKYLQAQHTLQLTLERTPTEEELQTALGWRKDELNRTYSAMNLMSVYSLSLVRPSEEMDELSGLDVLADEHAVNALQQLESQIEIEYLNEAIQQLPVRSQRFLHLHFVEGLNFVEIGRVLNVSASRASQIYREIIPRLRGHYLEQEAKAAPSQAAKGSN